MKRMFGGIVVLLVAGVAGGACAQVVVPGGGGLRMAAWQGTEPLVKDDLFAGTEKFAKGASDVTEVTMDPDTLDMVNGNGAKRAHNMVLNVVRTYSYDKPGMYRMEDVEEFRRKLNTGDWHCSVHTRDLKNGESTDVCNKRRGDAMVETAIITVEPKELTFIHTVRRSGGGSGPEAGGLFFQEPGMGGVAFSGPGMSAQNRAEMEVQMAEMHAQMAVSRAEMAAVGPEMRAEMAAIQPGMRAEIQRAMAGLHGKSFQGMQEFRFDPPVLHGFTELSPEVASPPVPVLSDPPVRPLPPTPPTSQPR